MNGAAVVASSAGVLTQVCTAKICLLGLATINDALRLDAAPIGYRVRVFLQAQNVTAPRHTMYNLFPGLPLNIEVCCRFAGGALSKWVNMEVVPAP